MLKLSNVSHCYAKSNQNAISNVDLAIESGTCFGLLGPNGAGKTTLISLMTGLLPLQSGQILYHNQSLAKLSIQQSQRISLIPQEYAFYPQLTVWENLQFFASLYHIKNRNFLCSLLEKVALLSYRNTLSKNLSGGLKRRLNFAIGLINSPSFIFMDEITVGVDPLSRQFILDSVKQLSREGVTIIYTSHYLQEIESLCHKIAIIEGGKLRYCDTVDNILTQNGHQHCLITLSKPVSADLLASIHGSVVANHSSYIIRINTLAIQLVSVLNSLKNYEILNVQYGYGSLESFYLNFLNQTAFINKDDK
ncbi:ABC transporter ATP-binding protein [Frischella sp. Ac13]|uniref:ABC transporter ATP-binding protein n=1 Tax=Frischella japonica TaxID=2741544 RepID=A0ABR7QY82_9GAMM|nr:ABC transporter ATP-binding protein [Frischella japonica]MBC9130923.1 ABC transporter ATP-binding protein [Frischella japonica]